MNNENSKTFLLVLLGLLTAFGPFVTDMYLPTLPSMTGYFGTTSSMVQLGLTSSMIGLALGQLFFVPLSDRYGRRPPLIAAMALFIVSTILCIFASDIRQFILLRLLQGLWITVQISGISVALSLVLGVLVGIFMMWQNPAARAVSVHRHTDTRLVELVIFIFSISDHITFQRSTSVTFSRLDSIQFKDTSLLVKISSLYTPFQTKIFRQHFFHFFHSKVLVYLSSIFIIGITYHRPVTIRI